MKSQRQAVPSEHAEQCALVEWIEVNRSRIPEALDFYAVPNGGRRSIGTAKKLRAEGVKPGIPDIENPHCRRGFTGIHIELKRRSGYSIEPEQIAWMDTLNNAGRLCVVARGWEEAACWIEWYFRKREWISTEEPEPTPVPSGFKQYGNAKKCLSANVWGKPASL